jgi:hypothetical protein
MSRNVSGLRSALLVTQKPVFRSLEDQHLEKTENQSKSKLHVMEFSCIKGFCRAEKKVGRDNDRKDYMMKEFL